MRRNVIALALILISLSSFQLIGFSKATDIVVGVNPPVLQLETAHIGQTVSVDIDISNVKNLWSWYVGNVTFNPSVLNLTRVTEGPLLKQGGQTLFIWTSQSHQIKNGVIPEISCTLLSNSSASGSGVLATLTFQVLSSGESGILLNQTRLHTPIEITPDITIVTGIYESINSSSTNGSIIIDNVTQAEPTSNMPLILATIAIVSVAIAVTVLYVKKSGVKKKR